MLGSVNVPVARAPLGPTIPAIVAFPLSMTPTSATIATMHPMATHPILKPTRSPRSLITLTSMMNQT